MALLGFFFGSYSPKYDPVLLKFSPEVVYKQKKVCFKNLWKIRIFTEKGRNQSLHFWSDFNPSFAPEDGRYRKN